MTKMQPVRLGDTTEREICFAVSYRYETELKDKLNWLIADV